MNVSQDISSSVSVFTVVVLIATLRKEVVGSYAGVKLCPPVVWLARTASPPWTRRKVRSGPLRLVSVSISRARVAVFRPWDSLPLIYDSERVKSHVGPGQWSSRRMGRNDPLRKGVRLIHAGESAKRLLEEGEKKLHGHCELEVHLCPFVLLITIL